MTSVNPFDTIKKALTDQQLPTQHRQDLTNAYVEFVKLAHYAEVIHLREIAAIKQAAAWKADNDNLRVHKILLESRDSHWRTYCDALTAGAKIFQTEISGLQQEITSLSDARETLSQQLDQADKYTKSVIDRHQSNSARHKTELDTLKTALGSCSCCQIELGLMPLMSCPHRVCHTCKPRLAVCPICRSKTGVQINGVS